MSTDSDVECPQCGSTNIETRPDGKYHCLNCDALFRSGAAGATIAGPESPPEDNEDEEGDGDE